MSAARPCVSCMVVHRGKGSRCSACSTARRRVTNQRYSHAWQKGLRGYLQRNPWCVDCGAPATERDHVPPRQILVALGVANPDAPRWLEPVCRRCHSKRTRSIDVVLLRRLVEGEDAQHLARIAYEQREVLRARNHCDSQTLQGERNDESDANANIA